MFVIKLQTVTQLERVHFIYEALEKEPLTVNAIHDKLINRKVEVGIRQIYHDLQQISSFYLRKDEKIISSVGQYNRKMFRLIKPSSEIELTARDLTTFQLTRSSTPRILQESRRESMDKFRNVYRKFITVNSAFYNFIPDGQNIRTFFYESSYDEKYNQTLDDIIWSIANYKFVRIFSVDGDATSVPKGIVYPLNFKPLLLIFHKGNHYVGGYAGNTDLFLTMDISKIANYELSVKTFAFKKLIQPAKKQLESRFGISNNMDDKTYPIELEFSSHMGDFVRHYYWHFTQETIPLPNGNWMMRMNCGINRELLRWLFQWMDNVRILQPKILIDLYKNKLASMAGNLDQKKPLTYTNVCQPK